MDKVRCAFCNSNHIQKDGRHKDMQWYRCMSCGKRFLFGEYKGEFSHITHFNTKIKKTDRNVLTRENYALLVGDNSTDEFGREHYHNCMRNFDLNTAYFETLDYAQFNQYLMKFVRKNGFKEITDLRELLEFQASILWPWINKSRFT